MSAAIDFSKYVKGEPVKVVVRVRPPTNFQKEDIRINNQTIILTDQNNRGFKDQSYNKIVLEEYEVPEVFGPECGMQQIFDTSFGQYIGPFIQGFNVNIFAYGSTGTGKTISLEGNKKEHGLIMFYSSQLFSLLDNKKFHTNGAQSSQVHNYSYGVRIRYIEIIDEEITDLLAPPQRRLSDQLQVVETTWEGPSISNATWVSVSNDSQLAEVLMSGSKSRNQTSNEFGKVANKAFGFFTIELIQTSVLKETNDPLVLISRMTFFDLPGSEILTENPEAIRIKQGSTVNKAIGSFTQLIKDIGQSNQEFIIFDASSLTTLHKELLGGNSLTVGLFCMQHGDTKGSSLTLNIQKFCSKIQNYPIVNDAKSLGILHQFRVECHQVKQNHVSSNSSNKYTGDAISSNQKLIQMEKKLIEDNLDKMRTSDDKQKLAQKLSAMRENYNNLVRQKTELQNELIKCEEDKLEVSKALVELQIENTRLMEIIQNEKYDMNNKLLNAEGELLSINTREEKALRVVQELQDRMATIAEDKRELEIEFVALKRNYLHVSSYLEAEKAKGENVGLELINIVNENKALHQELNDIYKKSGSTNEENSRFMKKLERVEAENREQREALMYSKADIERLKTEMLKYEILEQQHRVDIDNKKLEMEKGFLETNREKQTEVYRMNKGNEEQSKKQKEDRLLWDSQKIELTHKIKTLQRRVNDQEDRTKELERQLEETNTQSHKTILQMDEMRSVYRNKMLQITQQGDGTNGQQRQLRTGYDLNAREELMRTYTEKEIELNEKLGRERKQVAQLRLELRGARSYARNLRYLAEDWAPVGVPLPDILAKEPNFGGSQEENYGGLQSEHQAEIERLRARNKKLENEVRVLQDTLVNSTGKAGTDPNINQRLISELQMLKGQQRPQSSNMQNEQLRKERNEIQEENRRLVQLLKDTRKWDVHLLQRENERLLKQVKDVEMQGGTSMGPQSGENRNYQQKMAYYDKTIKQLEKERSEYMVRATMAEEQLKSLQEHLTRQAQDYQRKINEVKRANQGF